MPRIYSSCSDPIDFCRDCFPDEDEAERLYGLEAAGEGPDGRGDCFGYDAEHPDYAGEDYHCETCRERLTEADNDADQKSSSLSRRYDDGIGYASIE
jgi:hypothetical protein